MAMISNGRGSMETRTADRWGVSVLRDDAVEIGLGAVWQNVNIQ